MPRLNNLIKFGLGFMFAYMILTALHLWQPFREIHVQFFNASEQFVLNFFHPTAHTDFRLYRPEYSRGAPVGDFDFSIFVYDKTEWKRSRNKSNVEPFFIMNQRSKVVSIGPYTFLMALVLVTPLTWKRKLLSLFLGIILINIILALKYTFLFMDGADLSTGSFSLWGGIARILGNSFRTNEFFMFMVLVIWLLTSIRMKEIRWFMS